MPYMRTLPMPALLERHVHFRLDPSIRCNCLRHQSLVVRQISATLALGGMSTLARCLRCQGAETYRDAKRGASPPISCAGQTGIAVARSI